MVTKFANWNYIKLFLNLFDFKLNWLMQSNSKFIIYGGGTSRHETEI